MNIAIFIFDGVEELDFVGPWEVFTMVNTVLRMRKAEMLHRIYLVSEYDPSAIQD